MIKYKFEKFHLWILTTILSYFIDIYAGLILTFATITIFVQEGEIKGLKKEINNLKKIKEEKRNGESV